MNSYSDYLQHHGILGMKWGVRRYQNSDGTLTKAGKKRYQKQNYKDVVASYKKFLGGERDQTKSFDLVKRALLIDDIKKCVEEEKRLSKEMLPGYDNENNRRVYKAVKYLYAWEDGLIEDDHPFETLDAYLSGSDSSKVDTASNARYYGVSERSICAYLNNSNEKISKYIEQMDKNYSEYTKAVDKYVDETLGKYKNKIIDHKSISGVAERWLESQIFSGYVDSIGNEGYIFDLNRLSEDNFREKAKGYFYQEILKHLQR